MSLCPASDRSGLNPQFNSFVGSEIDLDATWTIKPWAVVRIGYGHFFAGDYVKSSLSAVGARPMRIGFTCKPH